MRTKKDKPAAEPLATKVRAALAQDWHTLDALEALAPGAPSTRRARVHAALEELRLAGMVREERYSKGVAEVRELPPVADGATCPACKAVVREHDDHHGWCGIGIRDCSWWAARGEARDGGATAAAAMAANTASGTASPSSMRSGAGRPSGRVATRGAATGIAGAVAARSVIGAIIDARESSAMFAGASRGWT